MAAPSNHYGETGSMFRLVAPGPRPRELTGAVDLLSYYGLRDQFETFCQKPLPVSIVDSHHLLNVIGDTEIRKGESMELGQLLQGHDAEPANLHIQPLNPEVLRQAFRLRESAPASLSEVDKGILIVKGKVKEEQKEKDKKHKKHKKHKDKDRHKDKDKDRHKDRDKDKDKDRDKDKQEKDRNKKRENGEDHSKKHHKKKRKHDNEEEDGEGHKHKKRKHKHSSKTAGVVPMKDGK